MEIQFAPNAVDEPNLLYKLQRKIKVFNTNSSLPNRGYNLVASSSKYGIVFIIAPNCTLSAYYLRDLIDKECEPQQLSIKLQIEPTYIAVNCDQEWLAVISKTMLFVYKIVDFQNQNILPSFSIKLDVNPSTFISAVQWNPCNPDTIAIACFDGTLLVSQVSTNQVKKLQSNVRCICWSPKGKQLVTGNNDGTLCQYKPDLSPMKTVPAPNLFEGAAVEALAIYWIATYQFVVVYRNATDNSRPAVTIVNTPKGGQPSCYNYEDICYSMGSNRPWYYYLQGLTQWNLILASSSNSMEIATLGSADGANWLQWCQIDEARPELPLTDKKQENYPVGICIDTCAIHQLPWGENATLPPMPLLHVLSQTGLLSIFNIINLKNDTTTPCTPPQQLTLPASLMTSTIPDDVTPQAAAPAAPAAPAVPAAPIVSTPVSQTVPQPAQAQFVPAQPQLTLQSTPALINQFNQPFASSNMQTFGIQQGLFSAPIPQIPETKQIETKPQIPVVQNAATLATPKPVVKVEAAKAQSPIQTPEMNAALKSEQERINKIKVNEELKNMLIKEVNDFQMELYKFMSKTRDNHIKLQQDIDSIGSDFNVQSQDIERLKKDYCIEELRESIVQLKLELVRACAVVAEARTHAENKHLHQWSQADPLTTKRVASVKKLAYYIQNQLDQAHKALDHKWNEIATRNLNEKPGQRMLRPILDDIYQPLVKQQEILSRQQAVLRTLRNTLKECGDITPMFKSTSILRRTPFRNKADPLSKLTKNILNMSIEPEKDKGKEQTMSNQKLDALKDMLSNHKTVKIKPVNVELRQQLAAMRQNYERSMKEKEVEKDKERNVQTAIKIEPGSSKIEPTVISAVKPDVVKSEQILEYESLPVITVPTTVHTPVNNKVVRPELPNVARTLFMDEPKPEPVKFPASQQQQQPLIQAAVKPEQPKATSGMVTVTSTTRSLLKDMLQNKSQTNGETKNDANIFMGQKICSPSAFEFSKTPIMMAAPSAVFTSKPIADINNMFSEFQSQTFSVEPTSQTQPINVKSSETGEPEGANKTLNEKKPLTNVFTLKPSTSLPAPSQNVPDVLKSSTQTFTLNKTDVNNKTDVKVKEKENANVKENIPENNKLPKEQQKPAGNVKDNGSKPLSLVNKASTPVSTTAQAAALTPISAQAENKGPVDVKPEITTSKSDLEKPEVPVISFDSTTASKPQTIFGASTTQATSVIQTTISTPSTTANESTIIKQTSEVVTTASASSIFGTAMASQRALQTTDSKPSSPTGSIFATSPASTASPFGLSSIFGTSSTTASTTGAGTSTAKSIFSSAVSATPLTTTSTSASTAVENKTTTSQPSSDTSSVSSTTKAFTPSTSSSIFGSQTTQTTVLTTTSTPTVTMQSIFGTSTSTTQSVFAPTSSTQSVFNSAAPTPVFGSAATTTQSVFGAAPTTTSSFWGTSTQNLGFQTTSPQTVFGGASTQASIFGTPTPSTEASVFGTPTQTTQSVFGSTTPTTQTSVFGTPTPTTTQSGSLFGGAEANLFAAASISTTNAPSPTSGGNIFGKSTGSVFGGGSTNVFGSKATFGQSNQSAAAIFGGANSTFKQNTSTNFWSGGSASTGNAFGSTGFGQQATTQASIFGGSTGGSFTAPSTGQPLGNPQAGAFGSSEAKPVFGSPQQQTTPAFGGSAMFGSKPVFGQTSSFGSSSGFGSFGGFNKSPSSGFGAPATFGGSPTFGSPGFGGSSPGKVFGGASPTPSFGAPTQSNATFENLATQNTLTFGNLAQQSNSPPQPSFNTSPSFTGWRG
ncbi:unnamed protein product [Parnassius apollo]|uniref:(apollo) hypothetical protein n=1 Tax=Parnassius apollo TaxID=110799 RepID=A0A8S3Y297_PARAO|nr:unnamed protein product [Parnassius apollo]